MMGEWMLYKAIVQLVLPYGSKSWVLTGDMLRLLEGLNHRSSRRITGMTAHRMTSREWDWPLVGYGLETAGIWPIKEYIHWSKDTILSQVA